MTKNDIIEAISEAITKSVRNNERVFVEGCHNDIFQAIAEAWEEASLPEGVVFYDLNDYNDDFYEIVFEMRHGYDAFITLRR